jgi:prepilin-type N-terminal cleavage/methylation domain-containing protein
MIPNSLTVLPERFAMRTNIASLRRRRGGLTLLELVMVVSILAILTALVVPGMNDQQEETRRTVARATLQELRDVIANRYAQDLVSPIVSLPVPHASDTVRNAATPQATGTSTTALPQLHFLFVNPNQYHTSSNPPYLAVNDYDQQTKIGWNGPYVMMKSTTYPNPTAVRFTKDPNNTDTWEEHGFTTTFGQPGDFCVNDPWGSPYVIIIRATSHGGSTAYTAYLTSAGFNRRLDQASWTTNADGTLNSGDDLTLPIKVWK